MLIIKFGTTDPFFQYKP